MRAFFEDVAIAAVWFVVLATLVATACVDIPPTVPIATGEPWNTSTLTW